MAGDWLKMRHDLVDDPAVIALATLDGVADRQHAVGLLHKFWSWADRQSANGDVSVTQEFLDLFVGARGFCALLIEQGWLNVSESNGWGSSSGRCVLFSLPVTSSLPETETGFW